VLFPSVFGKAQTNINGPRLQDDQKPACMEIEAVFSKAKQLMAWRELQDDGNWRQGWG
jgi:tryptophan-rich hypothetical protein